MMGRVKYITLDYCGGAYWVYLSNGHLMQAVELSSGLSARQSYHHARRVAYKLGAQLIIGNYRTKPGA